MIDPNYRQQDRGSSSVTWNDHERKEVDQLWSKVNRLDESVNELKTQTRLLESQTAHQARELNQSTGRLTEGLHNLAQDVRDMNNRLVVITTQRDTKGSLVDRWGPLAVALLAIIATHLFPSTEKSVKAPENPAKVQSFSHRGDS